MPCSPHPPPLISPLLPSPACSTVFSSHNTHVAITTFTKQLFLFGQLFLSGPSRKARRQQSTTPSPGYKPPLCMFAPVDCSIVLPIPQQGLPSITASLQALEATKKQLEREKYISRDQSWAQGRSLQGRNTVWLLDGQEKGGGRRGGEGMPVVGGKKRSKRRKTESQTSG